MLKIITNIKIYFFILIFVFGGCKGNTKGNTIENYDINHDIKIRDWDNSKYMDWVSSVGLNVYNSNSFIEVDGVTNKENNILKIYDLNEPIILDFNNNGKNRNFVLTVYYDYVQIPFKITQDGVYDLHYRFLLDDAKEIGLPLYLPEDLVMEDSHKLLISFMIGYDVHAMDLDTQSDWYGINMVYDLMYNDNLNFNSSEFFYNNPSNIIDVTYPFTLNDDYNFEIVDNSLLKKVNNKLQVKSGEKFNLVYNISTLGSETEKILLLVTLGFNQVKIDNDNYKLLKIQEGHTGIGTIELYAPEELGLYEVIGLSIYNPFDKINIDSDFLVDSSIRFTLEVVD